MEVDNNDMKDSCKSYNLKSLVRVPTCFKNPENLSCIDLILTNSPYSFHSSCVIETGLSDFHKMAVAVMKASFQKMKQKIITYRNFKLFSGELYKEDLVFDLPNKSSIRKIEKVPRDLQIRSRYASCKKIFMNKELSKAIITRTRLRNKFIRNRRAENRENFNKQHTYCVLLVRKSKREFYGNLNEKNVTDNKTFWKAMKLSFQVKQRTATK